jgi:serine/threonine-protein kinase RsbW
MICNDMETGTQRLRDGDQIVLGSTLAGMERLPAWIDGIATKLGLDERARFGVHLCLEEVVSNVVRHGYGDNGDGLVTVSCAEDGQGQIVFTVEDDAPAFNPLEGAELPAIGPEDTGLLGGQGIRLLRGFAETLEYEPKLGGNRLRIGFCATAPTLSDQSKPTQSKPN